MSLENVRQTDRKRDKDSDRGRQAGSKADMQAGVSVFLLLRPVPCKGLMTFMHNRRRPLQCPVLLVLWTAMSCIISPVDSIVLNYWFCVLHIVTCQKITIFSYYRHCAIFNIFYSLK
jgi:hypothetical protein